MARAAKLVGSLVGIAGVAFSITLLSQGMRSVMAVGGTCASGGPFQVRQQCPQGVAAAMPLAVVGGLIFLGLFYACASPGGRTAGLLAWSALFLTLAWNFIDYGTRSNSTGGAGFLIPGVLFVIMGVVPLFWVVPSMINAFRGKDEDEYAEYTKPLPRPVGSTGVGFATPTVSTPTWSTPGSGTAAATYPRVSPAPRSTPTPWNASASPGGDVATQIERLASLHRRGELSDAEFDEAKKQILQ